MARTFRSDQFNEILETIELWSTPGSNASMNTMHETLLNDKMDVSNYITEVLTQMATKKLLINRLYFYFIIYGLFNIALIYNSVNIHSHSRAFSQVIH